MKIRFVQKIIDMIRGKDASSPLFKFKMAAIHKKYNYTIKKLKNKVKNGEKIRVAFFSMYNSDFSLKPLYDKMLVDNVFEPFFVVIPDISRGESNMFYQMNKTYDTLVSNYQNVCKSYNEQTKEFVDFSDKIDLVCFDSPYDSQTHKYYKIKYLAQKGIPGFYTDYGFVISNLHYSLYSKQEYNTFWKIFALEKYQYKKLIDNIYNKNSAVLAGYSKMDLLSEVEPKNRNRKKIIIAPHHTVNMEELSLSNFFTYSDFFLELPAKYPDIDFVFRPHPLLFVTLKNDDLWGENKVDEYIAKMKSHLNVEYQDGGEYMDTFVNSDALIHDCGSFSAEYLFTDHPCCYLLKDEKTTNKNSNEFHKLCIEQHYKAYNEKDIIDFIENVVIAGNDDKKEQRSRFYNEILKNNYPNTTDYIFKYLKKEFDCD